MANCRMCKYSDFIHQEWGNELVCTKRNWERECEDYEDYRECKKGGCDNFEEQINDYPDEERDREYVFFNKH